MSVEVDDCEVTRSGLSFAIDTAKELQSQNPEVKFTWIVGSDSLMNLASWHKYEELVQVIDFLAINRPGHGVDPAKVHSNVQWSSIDIDALDISATAVRHLLAEGQDVSHLIPKEVHRYIIEKGLYDAA